MKVTVRDLAAACAFCSRVFGLVRSIHLRDSDGNLIEIANYAEVQDKSR